MNTDQEEVCVEQSNIRGNQENRDQEIGHGHADYQRVDGFSHGFRLVDRNYSDGGVPSQRNKKNQAVSNDCVDFFCSRIPVTAPWQYSIYRFVQVF